MPSLLSSWHAHRTALAFVIIALLARSVSVNAAADRSNAEKCGTRVEFIAPDGHSRLIGVNQTGDSGLIIKGGADFNLAAGENTFIVALPGSSTIDHVTFVNENAAACGRLRISVADEQLPALSAQWVSVDGSVAFAHKRLFNVSMLGVNAKFVRLTFSVQREMSIAKAPLEQSPISATFAAVDAISVYRFRPDGNGFLGAESSRAFARSEIGYVSRNLAMADTTLGFISTGH